MVILQKFSSAVLRSLRVVSAILGVVIGNIALNALSSQQSNVDLVAFSIAINLFTCVAPVD